MERGERHTDRKTYWRKVVAAWKASGLTKKVFCEQKQINYYSLLRWNKRLAGDTSALEPKVNAEEPTATRIEIVTATRLYSLIETCLVNNIEPYRYFKTLFHHLLHVEGQVDHSALLPQFIRMTD